MEGRVFVCMSLPTSKADRDLSSAQRYGRIEYVLPASPSASLTPGPSFMKAARKLRDFDPDKDYLVFPGGDPMALLVCGLALAELGITEVQILRWDRERAPGGGRTGAGYYVPTPVPLRLGARKLVEEKGAIW